VFHPASPWQCAMGCPPTPAAQHERRDMPSPPGERGKPQSSLAPDSALSLPTANCLLPTADCLLPTADCLLPTAYCRLLTADCLLVAADRRVPTADCLLVAADRRLPTADCLLPTADCLLPSSVRSDAAPASWQPTPVLFAIPESRRSPPPQRTEW